MNKDLLPIGSVIELNDGNRCIIIGYENNDECKIKYVCGGYPTYCCSDLLSSSKRKELSFNNVDTIIALDTEYKLIHEGYKNEKFYEFQNKIKNM